MSRLLYSLEQRSETDCVKLRAGFYTPLIQAITRLLTSSKLKVKLIQVITRIITTKSRSGYSTWHYYLKRLHISPGQGKKSEIPDRQKNKITKYEEDTNGSNRAQSKIAYEQSAMEKKTCTAIKKTGFPEKKTGLG